MTIRLNGQTSGYVELEAPAAAGSNTLVLPTGNGTSGQYLQTNGSGTLSWQNATPSLALIVDVKSSGTAGGTFTSGAWQTRDLNTEDYDADGIVSISSNQFTLGAGTYTLRASAPAFDVDEHIARIANTTDSTYFYGKTMYAGNGAYGMNDSEVWANFVITASKTFELQHYCKVTQTSSGYGLAASISGVSERYSTVQVIKWA